jgi:uncharacterized zinc-type alcohol dehydrogenase-like protein
MVNSCKSCKPCGDTTEQYCDSVTLTYNSACPDAPGYTLGGYSKRIVVHQTFVLSISHSAEQLPSVAPLLCAGITVYSPLKHWGAGPGKKVGVVGIGGLGHMGIKLSHALGAFTVAFTSSESKRKVGQAALLSARVLIFFSPPTPRKPLNWARTRSCGPSRRRSSSSTSTAST